MFEHFNYELLYMIKLFYDHTGIEYPVSLYDYEDGFNYELFQEMIGRIFYIINQDSDDYYNTLLDIFDPIITRFFDLCKQYSRKKHKAFQKNPFIAALKDEIKTFNYFGDLSYDNGFPKLFLRIDECDAYEYVNLLENLFLIKEFIEQQNKELETILCPTIGQSMMEHIERMAA